MTEHTSELQDIKTSVEKADYVVEPRAVAEAMLLRAAELRRERTLLGDVIEEPAER
jgi:hypothetical protein